MLGAADEWKMDESVCAYMHVFAHACILCVIQLEY